MSLQVFSLITGFEGSAFILYIFFLLNLKKIIVARFIYRPQEPLYHNLMNIFETVPEIQFIYIRIANLQVLDTKNKGVLNTARSIDVWRCFIPQPRRAH